MTVKLAFTTEEAATATGLSVDTIKRAIRSGALRAKRTAANDADGKGRGKYVITADALTKWLESLVDA